ncbi:hypothetical protein BJX70DRAFT_381154 [Aspergillus crustosus]
MEGHTAPNKTNLNPYYLGQRLALYGIGKVQQHRCMLALHTVWKTQLLERKRSQQQERAGAPTTRARWPQGTSRTFSTSDARRARNILSRVRNALEEVIVSLRVILDIRLAISNLNVNAAQNEAAANTPHRVWNMLDEVITGLMNVLEILFIISTFKPCRP